MRPTNTDMATAKAIGLIVDRHHCPDAETVLRQFGGGWTLAIDGWPADMAFVIAVAATAERMRKRAPLIIFVRDIGALPEAVQVACRQMGDVKCAWLPLVGGEAHEIVMRELLRDCRPAGAA